jgi:hypothetical protein
VQGLTLLFQEVVRIRNCLQSIAQVRDPHEIYGMADVGFAANLKSSPPGVRDPTVLFGLTFLQQRVANWSRKWDINGSVFVHVSDLCSPESKFTAAEPMRVDRDVRPGRNFARQSI